MRPALPLLAVLVLVGCGGSDLLTPSDALRSAQALPSDYAYPAHDTVRVATYNVENFVDAFDNPYIDNDRENAPDLDALAEKGRLFAEAIRALDADVLSIQEIESEQQLKLLADALFPEMGYRFFASTESPNWYQNVVVMSRLPLGPLTSFSDVWTPIEGQTNDDGTPATTSLVNHRLFAVEVRARPDYTFTLIAAHLKAGRGERNEGWRLGQINLLRSYLATLPPETNVLLAGDLNLLAGSLEYRCLTSGITPDFVENNPELVEEQPLLATCPNSGPSLADRTRRRGVPEFSPEDHTHPSEDPERRLDYLLVSWMELEMVPGSMRTARPLPHADLARLSDHLPVVADFIARDRRPGDPPPTR
ncbi:MAG: endonuclease/exonuclease/phosphatase family protein [Bacteroidota bacterium]